MSANHISGLMASCDRPFIENQGREIFDVLAKLKDYDRSGIYFQVSSSIGKFGELGFWSEAKQAFKYCQENYSGAPTVPSFVVHQLAEKQDMAEFVEWHKLCVDARKKSLVRAFCEHVNRQGIEPNLETVQTIDELARKDPISPMAFKFLVLGQWAHGNEEVCYELFDLIESHKHAQRMLVDTTALAIHRNLPTLAIELIPRIDDERTRLNAYMWYAAAMSRNRARLAELDDWIPKQEPLVQIVTQLGVAKGLLGYRFDGFE